jgi:hypothetical protein
MPQDKIVAVGLLTAGDLDMLGPAFKRLWPVEETPCFSGILQAIDEADREIRRDTATTTMSRTAKSA